MFNQEVFMNDHRIFPTRLAVVGVLSVLLAGGLSASESGILPQEYRQRRDSLLARMEPHSIAVFRANDPDNRSNDVNYRYRQESNFLYLTGVDEPGSTLLLSVDGVKLPEGASVREILFVDPPRSDGVTGETLGLEGAKSKGEFEQVLERKEFTRIFESALEGQSVLYLLNPTPDFIVNPYTGSRMIQSRETRKALEEKFTGLSVKNPSSMVAELRVIKSESEMLLLRQAIQATADGHIEAMKSCEPGMFEYELQAVVEYCFARAGAEYQGFPSIIGSGPNSCILHYDLNRRKMEPGDVVVLDIGAEVQGYSADVTRTLPVSGTFTKEQRELYDLVYEAQEAVFRAARPGASLRDLTNVSNQVIGEGLVVLGILKDKGEARTYTRHGVSHFLGLDVHDVGGFSAVLQPGMVVTVEPGIYIPEDSACDQKYWNIGIRIEDDILVTSDGCQVLSSRAPRSSADVEDTMKAKGIGNTPLGR